MSRRLRGMSFKALSLCGLDVDRSATLLAGDARPTLQRVIDSVVARLREADDILVESVPAEYRRHALHVVTALRRRRA